MTTIIIIALLINIIATRLINAKPKEKCWVDRTENIKMTIVITIVLLTHIILSLFFKAKGKPKEQKYWVDRHGRMYGEAENKDYQEIKKLIDSSDTVMNLDGHRHSLRRYRMMYGDNALYEELWAEYAAQMCVIDCWSVKN